ncbi:hypothetical protein L195_g008299, partial [Trifolium pratense]
MASSSPTPPESSSPTPIPEERVPIHIVRSTQLPIGRSSPSLCIIQVFIIGPVKQIKKAEDMLRG